MLELDIDHGNVRINKYANNLYKYTIGRTLVYYSKECSLHFSFRINDIIIYDNRNKICMFQFLRNHQEIVYARIEDDYYLNISKMEYDNDIGNCFKPYKLENISMFFSNLISESSMKNIIKETVNKELGSLPSDIRHLIKQYI